MAREAVAGSTVRTSDGEIPIVTVERTPNGLEILSTPVSDVDEAAALATDLAASSDLATVEVDAPVVALDHPPANDPLRPQQWALDRVAFEHAWSVAGTRGAGVRVAVIDTGVRGNHEDLVDRVQPGFFFLSSNDGRMQFEGAGGNSDSDGHGTHVAGIIGAGAGNGKGITGAAPEVQFVPVQVLCPGPSGGGWSFDVAKGIEWAANPDKGNADVINLSLSGGASSAVLQALKYAEENGVVIVASAGNCGEGKGSCSGVNAPSYPAAYPQAIAVAATTNNDGHASYSTSGSYVEIAAPGGMPSNNNDAAVSVLSTWNNGAYRAIAGTSMAAPHVSAAAALLVAKGCTAAQVRNRLVDTAVDLGSDMQFGAGLVNPVDALASCT